MRLYEDFSRWQNTVHLSILLLYFCIPVLSNIFFATKFTLVIGIEWSHESREQKKDTPFDRKPLS